jgi:aryl carrier-like protein
LSAGTDTRASSTAALHTWPAHLVPAIRPRADPRDVPFSFDQERLWFLDHLEPGSPRYNVFSVLRVQGTLRAGILALSLGEIVRRHEALRTLFLDTDGRLQLRVAAAGPFPLVTLDLRGIDPSQVTAKVERLARNEAMRPFRLAKGPLLRATLLRLEEAEDVLFLSTHLIAADGWSRRILTGELWTLYEAFSEGRPSPLPELPIQYADFAAWQRQCLNAERLEVQLSYWRHQLQDLTPLTLPTDRPRPPVQGFDGASRVRRLGDGLLERVKTLSRREGVTPFMTFLAAFMALLHRYTGQDDMAVGCPIANRPRPETEALIGFFGSTLVLRTSLSGNPTFRELMVRVRDVTLGAYAHSDVPLQRLVKELRRQRDPRRPPLFQVAFAIPDAAPPEVRLPGLTVTHGHVEQTVSHFDLTLYVAESDPAFLELEYRTDLFDAATIDRMAGHLHTLLESAVEEPGRRLSELAGGRDHPVKERGFRIELGEIESVLTRHPAVKEAVVIARRGDPGEKWLVAYVVWKNDSPRVTSSELRSWVGEQLPACMVPSAVVGLKAPPLGPGNELDRRALAVFETPGSAAAARLAPRNAMERVVADAWLEALGVPEVGIDDNFFDAGGDSLRILRVNCDLERRLGRRIAVAELFRHPTIRALAALLKDPAAVGSTVDSARERARTRRSVPTGAAVSERGGTRTSGDQ